MVANLMHIMNIYKQNMHIIEVLVVVLVVVVV